MSEFNKLSKENVENIISLTPMQEGLLFHYIREKDSNLYFEQISLEINKAVDKDIFKKAWELVIRSNEMLRAVYRFGSIDKNIQIVLKEKEPDIRYIDCSQELHSDLDTLIKTLRLKDREEKFDLSDVAFRITLCKLDSARYEMIVSNHHILYDGWSNGVILREFLEYYNSLVDKKEIVAIEKTGFSKFISWIQKQDTKTCECYWKEYLKDLNTKTKVIKKRTNLSDTVSDVEEYSIRIDKQKLYAFTKENRITPASLIYTAWGLLLQVYNGNEDAVFGTTVSGRNSKIDGIEDMVGLLINTVPLRIKSDSSDSIKELLQRINEDVQTRADFEYAPLVDIKKYAGISTKDEMFDSIVVIENYPLSSVLTKEENEMTFDAYSMYEMNNFDLTIGVTMFEKIEISFSYAMNLFVKEDIITIGDHLKKVIHFIIENVNSKVGDIELLSDKERQKILHEFNQTEIDYNKELTVTKLFEEQAKSEPDHIALVFSGMELTYGELNKKANQLAHLLTEKGVKKGDVVGIMTERSLEMVISIIGVLKAGAAYLPISPEYPYKRKQYLIDDSKAKAIGCE
jgi:hypothetical protein